MATVLVIKQLASGTVTIARNPIYTAPAATSTIVNDITFINTSAATSQVVNVWVNDQRVVPVDLVLLPKYMLVLDDVITLGSGDEVFASTTTASILDYVVNGVEET